MIQGTGNAFPISNLYKSNLSNIQKMKDSVKSYRDECNSTLLNLKECFDQNYDPEVHNEPIDGSETVTMKFRLLAHCNWNYYVNCRQKDEERLN